jgi:DNA-binding NtrC family response regulator
MQRLLLVEDDAAFRELLSLHLEDAGYQVEVVATLAAARVALGRADALLLDQRLPDGGGIDFLAEVHEQRPDLPVIMITGLSDTDLAIAAIKAGAYDFIRKPVDTTALDATLRNALHSHNLARKIKFVAESTRVGLDGIVGVSQAMLDVCKTIGRVAPTQACVLISGESGTGKEVVARAIHSHSDRHGLFLPINCSAIVETLLENELFGHEKGSYTGAVATKAGKFELAQDGTLFLDEIGDLPLPLQAKLLRVLQEGGFERVGGNRTLNCNARIVAATHRDLASMVAQETFREDLYYRLNVVTLHLQPLRQRPEDLPALVEHLLTRIAGRVHKSISRISEPAWRALSAYAWPGNVRELENVLTRAVVLARGDTLTPELLNLTPLAAHSPPMPEESGHLLSLDELEARHIAHVLGETRWHKGKACAILGISRPALERKLRKYSLG